MTPEQYEALISEIYGPRPSFIRLGQHAFNTLYKHDPDLANKIRGTVSDPFYNDSRLSNFMGEIAGSISTQMSEKESQPCPLNAPLNTD